MTLKAIRLGGLTIDNNVWMSPLCGVTDIPFRALVKDLAEHLRRGHRVGIHCWGSIGRAPLTTACTLIHLGWKPQAALAAIESARGCEVPETEEQRQWVLNFKAPA